MTHEQKQPPEAFIEAETPPGDPPVTWRTRRWLGLQIGDWAVIAGLFLMMIAGTRVIGILIRGRQPDRYSLAIIGIWGIIQGTLAGSLLVYVVLRRRLVDLRITSADLVDLCRRTIAETRSIADEMRAMAKSPYWEELTAAAQARADELERELDARSALLPVSSTALRDIADRVAELQHTLAQTQANQLTLRDGLAKIEAGLAEIDELARLVERRRQLQLDAVDQRILELLSANWNLTDKQIGADPKVALERSQVTRRRNRLAARGYAAAQKRQGQRPPPL